MSLHLLLASAALETTAAAEDAGSGRLESVAALLLGVASIAVGALAVVHANRRVARNGLHAALLSMALGLAGVAVGAVLVADSDGDVGTGNGRGGAIVALAVGAIGVGVGGLATARSRRVSRSAA